jgi:hypothetical protein
MQGDAQPSSIPGRRQTIQLAGLKDQHAGREIEMILPQPRESPPDEGDGDATPHDRSKNRPNDSLPLARLGWAGDDRLQ